MHGLETERKVILSSRMLILWTRVDSESLKSICLRTLPPISEARFARHWGAFNLRVPRAMCIMCFKDTFFLFDIA